ncbi:H-NS histone family protein [Burkholderia sp. AU30280]|nr:H-NS family nucleoid-associated regulatory protein [Burkholderia sp. AU30280]MCA8277350.1 H-NS histone family protein [Burkholderia sp. AU30280]
MYRDPVTGQTWNGSGRLPKWLKGKQRELYLAIR